MKVEKITAFRGKLLKESNWDWDIDINGIWSQMASSIKRVAKEVLGESKGRRNMLTNT